tara:strand:- start:80 stop:1063 length:984 start_codon:yes stop_codon:yes gene_type:complete
MIKERIDEFINAPSDSINMGNVELLDLKDRVQLYWGDEPIAFLNKGENIFSPIVELINSEFIESNRKILITKKIQTWIDERILNVLKPIKDNIEEQVDSADIRLITFNLFNSLGTMLIEDFRSQIKKLSIENKLIVSKLGIRIGAKYFFIPNFLKKNSIELKALLWKVYNNDNIEGHYPLPKDGRVSFTADQSMPDSYWLAIGYLCIKNFAVRVDVFERIFFIARKKIKVGPFIETSELMNPVGCTSDQLASILSMCGFNYLTLDNERKLYFYVIKNKLLKRDKTQKLKKIHIINKKKKMKKSKKSKESKELKIDPNSPFAVLQKLL